MLQAQAKPSTNFKLKTCPCTSNKQVFSRFPCGSDIGEGSLFALHQAVEEVPFGWVCGAVVCLLTGFPACRQQSMNCQAKHKPTIVHDKITCNTLCKRVTHRLPGPDFQVPSAGSAQKPSASAAMSPLA